MSTALTELADIVSRSQNPVFKRIAELAKERSLATSVKVLPQAQIIAHLRSVNPEKFGSLPDDAPHIGVYDPYTDTIMLAQEIVGTAEADWVIIHETGHALSVHAINRVQRAARLGGSQHVNARDRQLVARLEELFEEAKAQLPAVDADGTPAYWRTNLKEFVAEAWSNEGLQLQMLQTAASARPNVAGGTRSLWSKFLQALREYFTVKPADVNLLEEVLYASENLAKASRNYYVESEGYRTLSPAVRQEGAGRTAPDDDFEARLRRYAQYTLPNDQPLPPDNPANRAEVEGVRESVEQANRHHYFGQVQSGEGAGRMGSAAPLDNGRWRVTTSDGLLTDVATVDEALQLLRDNGITAKVRSEARATATGHTFVDNYAKATPMVRGLANSLRRAVGVVDSAAGEMMGTRALDAFGSLVTRFASQHYFLDRMDNAVAALSGTNPNLSLRVQNIARQIAVAGRSDELGQFGQRIARLITDSGVTDMREGSLFLVARHVAERNARYAGKPRPDGTGNYGPDVTGFSWGGLRGNEAAEAFLANLSPDKRVVLEAVGDTYDQARQHVLAFQRQTGVLSDESYKAMGGVFGGDMQVDGAWKHYVRMVDWRSTLADAPGTGRVSGGQGGRDVDYTRALDVAFSDLERSYKSALRNAAHVEIANMARNYPQLMDVRIQSQKLSQSRAGRVGDGADWRLEDFYGENSLVFHENGERKTMTFSDPDAMRYIEAHRGTPNLAMRTLAAVTHMMASTRTTFAPAFWAQSVAWDTLMSVLGMEYAGRGTLTTSEAMSVSRRTLALMPRNFAALVGRASQHATNNPFLQVYGQRGGGVAPGSRAGIEDTAATLFTPAMNPLAQGLGVASRLQSAGARAMQVLHSTEDMARFSAFQAYIEHKAGRKFQTYDALNTYLEENPSVLEHALDVSRRITGDFAERGTSAWPRAVFMFFNPAVAGARQLTGIARTRSGQVGLASLFALGAMTAARFLSDDEDEDLDGGSRYLRRQGVGRQMQLTDTAAWPLAPEGRAAFRAGEMMVAFGMGKVSLMEASTAVAGSIVDTFAPLNVPDADAPIESVAYGLAPALFQPIITAAFGVDSWGNSTEIDANLARGPGGERIPQAANAERGRGRDPQFMKDAAVWAKDNLGIDVFPGRAWEVMRTLGGSSLTYLQRSLDEGVVSATTRAYQNRPDEFAITREFDRTAAEFEQEFRALQRQDNVLSMPPGRAAATLRMRQAQQKIDDARVNGMSQSQMYRLRDYYRASGSDEGAAAMQQLIDNLQEYRNHIRANALRDVREMQQ